MSEDDAGKLRSQTARGATYIGLAQLVRMGVSTITSLLLARLLSPDDFGLFAMAFVLAELAQLFVDFGIGSAIVQKQAHSRLALSSCFWLNLGVAATAALIVAAGAPLVALYFARPELIPLVLGTAVSFLFTGAAVVPNALLTRDMRFAAIVKVQLTASLLGAAAALWVAQAGGGAWSLLIQPVAGSVVACTGYFFAARWRPGFEFQFASARDLIKTGSHLLAGSLMAQVTLQANTFVVGRMLGPASVGLLSMANMLAYLPQYSVGIAASRVIFPAMARIQHRADLLVKALGEATATITMLTFPMLAGLVVVAPDAVPLILGAQWNDALPLLHIVAIMFAVGSTANACYSLLLARGQTRYLLVLGAIALVATYSLTPLGAHWGGLQGALWCSASAQMACNVLAIRRALAIAEVPLKNFVSSVAPNAACTAGMVLAVIAVRTMTPDWSLLGRLSVSIVTGAVIYLTLLLTLNPRPARNLLDALTAKG